MEPLIKSISKEIKIGDNYRWKNKYLKIEAKI